MARQPIAVFGAGGFGLEVAMLIDQINDREPTWEHVGFFDDGKEPGAVIMGRPVLGGLDALNAWDGPLALAFALGMPRTKAAVVAKLTKADLSFPTLVHPSVISGSAEYVSVGAGSILCAGTILTTAIEIGRFVILNLACTVGHETTIGDHSSFMPTCNISGEVSIGQRTFWGTGAKVINRVSVGDDAIIGAGAVVVRDVPPGVTAVGVPAKVLPKRPA